MFNNFRYTLFSYIQAKSKIYYCKYMPWQPNLTGYKHVAWENRRGKPRRLQTLHRLASPLCKKKKKIWHVTPDTWHLTPDTWHLTLDTWHVTLGGGWTFCQNFSSLALSVRAGKWFEDLEEKDPSVNQSVNQSVTEVFVEQPRLHRVC